MSHEDTLNERWRGPGGAPPAHVGATRPRCRVDVRLGHFVRGYAPWNLQDVNASIYGESAERPWQATWTPRSSWETLPNVKEVSLDHGLDDSKGVTVATLAMDNVLLAARTGAFAQVYHQIERGALSPYRGSPYSWRAEEGVAPNQWYGYLTKNAQIKIWQGYGDVLIPTFTGLIADVDLTSSPDAITCVARDFGHVLSDEHVFGWSITAALPEPTIFQSEGALGNAIGVGYGPAASTTRDGHPERFVIDKDLNSAWISHDHTTPGNTEWIEIRLPRGIYDSFAIHNLYPGMEMYVGVYARANNHDGRPCTIDGQEIEDGWILAGNGNVPGVNGGWPWLRRWGSVSDKGNAHLLKHRLDLGDDSVLRVAFRNLGKIDDGVYRAGCVRLAGIRRPKSELTDAAYKKVLGKVVQVGDLSDMVKVVLRWAGFKEWNVASTGASIGSKWTFNRADTLQTIIDKCVELTGYVFYMAPPTEDPESLGIPTFEPNYAMSSQSNMQTVRDTDLLTGVSVHHTDEPLSSIIRVRGEPSKANGEILGMETELRVMAIYRPPWAVDKQLAGVLKHQISSNDYRMLSLTECEVMARKIALLEALASDTAEIEIPGNPTFHLNRQIVLFDTGTGLNTRLWIAKRTSRMTLGTTTSWKTTLAGALLDTTHLQRVVTDLQGVLGGDVIEIGDSFFSLGD